jgi:ATP phosphoribosyltransferase regulatory subunit HisZ
MNNNRILPNGFYDLSGQEAKKHYEYTRMLIDNFLANNYNLIKTSIIEYCKNYRDDELIGVYKFADPITREQIFIRHDITMQIAKYVAKNINQLKNQLYKFCYYGDTINLNSDIANVQRQQTQVGCEIIGDSTINSCFNVLNDILKILKDISDVKIFIILPDFLKIFLVAINQLDNHDLKVAIINKNISDVKKYDEKNHDLISEIILNNFDYPKLFSQIIKQISNDSINNELSMASQLIEFMQKNFANIEINFDLFGDNNSSYHNKIAFDIFANNYKMPLAKGGCYTIDNGSEKIDAVGATIYLNNLQKI